MKHKLVQTKAPLLEELLHYQTLGRIGFHTPGHRGGRSLGENFCHASLLGLDLTEITGLDWEGALEKATGLAAEFYHADYSYFLVQGATQGILTALVGCFHPGDQVLVGRNCHQAVIHGLILAGLTPVWMPAYSIPGWGIGAGIRPNTLQAYVSAHPEAKGVIITNPTYQGIADRIDSIRKWIGDRILVVDEAHGGHLGWCGISGFDAWQAADLWVQGTHKFLGSLTQTAMLHLKCGKIDPQGIQNGLSLVTTTSPSYILLAALDANRRFLATGGNTQFLEKLTLVRKLREALARIEGLRVLTEANIDAPHQTVDPWKLVFSCEEWGLTGYQAERILRSRYRIDVEYADVAQVTCFLAPWQDEADFDRLLGALVKISGARQDHGVKHQTMKSLPGIPKQILSPREAMFAPAVELPFEQAKGRIAATVISPYPPGIPLVMPGELINSEILEFVTEILQQGGRVSGVDSRFGNIRCVEGRDG